LNQGKEWIKTTEHQVLKKGLFGEYEIIGKSKLGLKRLKKLYPKNKYIIRNKYGERV